MLREQNHPLLCQNGRIFWIRRPIARLARQGRPLSQNADLEQMYAERVGGKMPRYYRPAQGCFSRQNLECAQKNGYKTIFWSFAYADWDNEKQPDPQKAKQIILDNVHNGAVILLHPTSATNAKILGEVIREMKAQGYRFGSLEELTCAKAE